MWFKLSREKKKYLKYRDALIFCSEGTAHIDNGTMSVHPNFNHMGPDKDNSKWFFLAHRISF